MAGTSRGMVGWWRWRAQVRSAVHMFADTTFQQDRWLADDPAYGTPTDAVYRLVGDTWLDRWSASRYLGCVFTSDDECMAVDSAVIAVLAVLHEVGEDAPAADWLAHPGWPAAVDAARTAHRLLAESDQDEEPTRTPESLEVLAIRTGAR